MRNNYSVLGVLMMLTGVQSHGRLTMPAPRECKEGACFIEDEYTPLNFNCDFCPESQRWPALNPSKHPDKSSFVCRINNKDHTTKMTSLVAGQALPVRWEMTADHPGDAGLFISYDYDFDNELQMKWFKIANFPQARRNNKQTISVAIPEWLPAGRAVLRWGWYATHNAPWVEYFVNCVDVLVVSTSTVSVQAIPSYKIEIGSGPNQYAQSCAGQTTCTQTMQENSYCWDCEPAAYAELGTQGPSCVGGISGNCCDPAFTSPNIPASVYQPVDYLASTGGGFNQCKGKGFSGPAPFLTATPGPPTTNPPTPQPPSTGSCSDLAWEDDAGNTCKSPDITKAWCSSYGMEVFPKGTANSACCTCGGGLITTTTTKPPTKPPTKLPTNALTKAPTKVPTNTPTNTPTSIPVTTGEIAAASGSFCSPNNQFCLSWKPATGESNTIELTIDAETTGWASVGFSGAKVTSMPGVDIILCQTSSGSVVAVDATNSNYNTPLVDVQQDITTIATAVEGGRLTCTVRRPLVTSDSNDKPIAAGDYNIMWAFGNIDTEGTVLYHGKNKGRAPVELAKAKASPPSTGSEGFDFGSGCPAGDGEFQLDLPIEGEAKDVGVIPAGKWSVRVWLSADTDIDISLYDMDDTREFPEGKAVVAWCGSTNCNLGALGIDSGTATAAYKGMSVSYSGYNGDGTGYGNEWIEISGETTTNLKMRAFAFRAGSATVKYSWKFAQTDCCLGRAACGGSFSQKIVEGAIVQVGEIPVGKLDLRVALTSPVDVDIQLYDLDDTSTFSEGKAIVGWCGQSGCNKGSLSGPSTGSTVYPSGSTAGILYKYSGYNGDGNGQGHEYIEISGATTRKLMMAAYGYNAGEASITYSYWEPTQASTARLNRVQPRVGHRTRSSRGRGLYSARNPFDL